SSSARGSWGTRSTRSSTANTFTWISSHARESMRRDPRTKEFAMKTLSLSRSSVLIAALAAFSALPLAPAHAANMNKVIHHVFPVAETGFDPQAVHDLYSGTVVQAIFETLLTYDYLARPSKLVPMAAEALPQISDGGKTYTFKIKKGIYFTDDAA